MSENKLTRTLIGKAISTKMDKTVTVLVERKVKHPIGKIVVKARSTMFMTKTMTLGRRYRRNLRNTSDFPHEILDSFQDRRTC